MTLGLPDGAITGDADGRYCKVFRPRWWQLSRWARWLLLPAERKTEVDVLWVLPISKGGFGRKRVRAVVIDRPQVFGRGVH